MTNDQILEYSNLIYKIASYFKGYKNKDDLYQAGYMGLIMAYKNYNQNENTKFTTYAYSYIFGEMCKLVREDKNIKLNRTTTRLKMSIEKASNYLSQKNLRKPTNKEIADYLELSLEEVEYALKTVNMFQSIDEPIKGDEKDMSLYDIIESPNVDIDSLILLKDEINKLDEESKKILLYSINTGLSQKELGEIFNKNQVQISRTLTKIKTKIKSNAA